MTCIVAAIDEDYVYIGADSAGVDKTTFSSHVRRDKKVFERGPFLFGFTSSFRMGQLLQYKLVLPEQADGQSDFAFLVGPFIDAVRQCFTDGGFTQKTQEREVGGVFLIAYRDNIYTIYDNFQIEQVAHPYNAIGCGEEVAKGSLYSSVGHRVTKTRVLLALKAAAYFSGAVRGPFHIIRQKRAKCA